MNQPSSDNQIKQQPGRGDWIRYVVLVCLWGSAFSLSKIAIAELSPTIVAAVRIWVAIGLLYGWMIFRKHKLPQIWPRPDARWLWFLPVGITGSALPFLLNAWAMQSLDSGLVAILLATMPLSVALLTHFTIPGDQLSLGKVGGLVLGLFGIILLIGPAALHDLGGPTAIAQFAVLLSAATYAVNSVLVHFMPETPPSVAATGMLLIGGIALAPFALIDASHTPMPSLGTMVAVVALALGATGLGSILYMQTVRSAGPSFIATSNYFVPPFAVFVGVLFLGEKLSVLAFAALAIIFLGILLERKKS